MATHINPDSGRLVIESTNAFANIAAPTSVEAALHNKGSQYVELDMYIGGTLIVNGDVITFGNTGGAITFNANISSDVIPDVSGGIQYDLGSGIKPWDLAYIEKLILSTNPTTATTTISATKGTVYLDGSTNTTPSLANGVAGERKTILVTATPAGPITITPTTALGYTNLQFTAVGDSAELMYTALGWSILSVFRTSVT